MTPQTTIAAPPTVELTNQPTSIICPYCYANVVTRTYYKNGLLTWLLALACVLLGLDYSIKMN